MGQAFDSVLPILSKNLRETLRRIPKTDQKKISEIRLRVQQPLCLKTQEGLRFVTQNGSLIPIGSEPSILVTREDVQETYQIACCYSPYAVEQELSQGYVTTTSGHRIGVCGTAVLEQGQIRYVKDITSLNIRIARASVGIAEPLYQTIQHRLHQGLLLVGKPASGKTTMLRDLCRCIASDGKSTVVLMDHRGEIAGAAQGKFAYAVGSCCDVLNGYPKQAGIQQAIRCLSPDYLLCDEVGSAEDVAAMVAGVHAGVAMIATVHADCGKALLRRPQGKALLQTGAFGTIAVLEKEPSFGTISALISADDLVL